jgi:hypothetical protein
MPAPTLDEAAVRDLIRQELPDLVRRDPALRLFVLDVASGRYAERGETEHRIEQILEELRREREEGARRWEENTRKWAEDSLRWQEQSRKWQEQEERWQEENRRWQEQEGRWQEQSRKWEQQEERWQEQSRRWQEQEARWQEQNRKWDEATRALAETREEWNRRWAESDRRFEETRKEWARRWAESDDRFQASRKEWEERWLESSRRHAEEFDRVHNEIMALAAKQERTLGALGARWGLNTERSFRDALAAILGQSFGVEVLNVVEWDDAGEVFGRPEQVELDVIVRDGTLIICEIKSSIDKAGLYAFERKARFYERLHARKADRLIVISPMVDPRARPVAQRLGLEVYADSLDVPGSGPSPLAP